MGRSDRHALISKIEKLRNSRILIYITGDREGLQTKIGVDTFPFIAEHLSRFDNPERIDLFLYSTGGITMAGYSLVNMIREYCNSFGVLVPFKALSCATLVTLGANEIIMSKMGQLSPIDPSVNHPLGPSVQIGSHGERQILPVNVEDIFNYLDLAREELKIIDVDSLERVLENLSKSIHPLVLGHGYKLREQIEFLARNLLAYHIKDEKKISFIVDNLIRGRFSHDYVFNRREAKEVLGLPIGDCREVEKLLISLFSEYQSMLELSNPYSPEIAIGDNDELRRSFDRAIIESTDSTHVFRSEIVFRRQNIPIPGTNITLPQVIQGIIHEGWREDSTI